MSDKHRWHKRYHSDAIVGYGPLSLELRGAYTTILDLLYDTGGEQGLYDNERYLSGIMNCSTRKWRTLKNDLIAAGKIIVLEDGKLSNKRYLEELSDKKKVSKERAVSGAKGGKKKAENGIDFPEDSLSSARFQGSKTSRKRAENELSQTRNFDELTLKPAENLDSALAKPKQNPSYTRAKELRVKKEVRIREESKRGSKRTREINCETNAGPSKTASPPMTKTTSLEKPKRNSAISDKFEPVLSDKALAIVKNWPPKMADSELQKFIDYHTAKGSMMKDWQAAFRTWIRKADEWRNQNDKRNKRTGSSLLDACLE